MPERKDLPFQKLLGVHRGRHGRMELVLGESVKNHLGNMHASAQFALAEISSGDCLGQQFPQWRDRVVAVVRRAEIKYSSPVETELQAYAHIEEDEQQRFLQQLENKGRALVSVHVELKDRQGALATKAVYQWFVQTRLVV